MEGVGMGKKKEGGTELKRKQGGMGNSKEGTKKDTAKPNWSRVVTLVVDKLNGYVLLIA